MIKNEKIQIRISEELLDYCKENFDNVSLFIRQAIREKIESGLLPDPSLSFIEIRARTPYTFFAKLDRIIDGDTIVVSADLGFFINVTVKLRLAGIDCPPIDTPEGKKATSFLEKELENTNLVIETRKKEKWGRYISYIYYDNKYKDFEDILRYGKLINEELVKNGLANRY